MFDENEWNRFTGVRGMGLGGGWFARVWTLRLDSNSC